MVICLSFQQSNVLLRTYSLNGGSCMLENHENSKNCFLSEAWTERSEARRPLCSQPGTPGGCDGLAPLRYGSLPPPIYTPYKPAARV
jgi:hypothetical protein